MADPVIATGSDAIEGETPNQRQARLRREKRQKKMAEQGEDRLARIKALNGGVAPPDEVLGGPTAKAKPATVEDPDEVDIATVSGTGTPSSNARPMHPSNDPLAAAMLQMQQQQARQQNSGVDPEDPMVKMMQQLSSMMGGNPQNPNGPNQMQELPPMLKTFMNGGQGTAEMQQTPPSSSTYVWRITHAIFAFTLAIYVTMTSPFNGTKLARSQSVYAEQATSGLGPRLFWIFVTAELLLQSTRYFVEKGQLQGNGILAKIAGSGFLPPPYDQYVRTLGRYISIFQTIMADAMVLVFTLGALAWWSALGTA